MHFKAGAVKPKATLEIGSKTYTIKAPLVGQVSKMSEAIQAETSRQKQGEIPKQFICDLGGIPMKELELLEQETFDALFAHVIDSKKN